jgi:hypothetical protein
MPRPLRPAAYTTVVATLTALLVLSGCASVVTGSGHNSGAPTTGSSGDFPSGGTSSGPGTSSEPASTTAAPSTSTAPTDSDITDVKYTVPTGWERTTQYVEVIPLETSYDVKYLIPSGAAPGLDVISIVLYRLPATHLVDTRAQQVARIHGYEQKRRLTIVHALEETTIGGRRAFDESVKQPGGSQGEFRYASWYVFGGAHLVQIACQVESHVDTVATGCQKLLDSMTFS